MVITASVVAVATIALLMKYMKNVVGTPKTLVDPAVKVPLKLIEKEVSNCKFESTFSSFSTSTLSVHSSSG